METLVTLARILINDKKHISPNGTGNNIIQVGIFIYKHSSASQTLTCMHADYLSYSRWLGPSCKISLQMQI